MEIKVGDRVKCFVGRVNLENGKAREITEWAEGIVYHIGDKVLAFEADNGHIYGVKKDSVFLA